MTSQIEKLAFARRHLGLLAGVGIVALLARGRTAKAFTCTTGSAVTPANPGGLNPTFAGDPDCETGLLIEEGLLPDPTGHYNHCFLKGTAIITRQGERAIETIAPGDHVLARNEGFVPVEAVFCMDMLDPPVRIARGALTGSVPNADLVVSAGHALLVKDKLVTAASLVNGRTITYDFQQTETAYFHLQLAHHAVIYAHGAPCETYVEEGAVMAMPVIGQGGGLSKIGSHLRSALSPWLDWRTDGDIIRDDLDR